MPAVRRRESLRSIFIPQSCKRRNLGQVEPNEEPEYISSSESEVSLSPEPSQDTGPYELLHEYGIVVCTVCHIGIEPTEIASHLREDHERSPGEAEQIAGNVEEWPYKRSIENIVWPTEPIRTIPSLGEPDDAFKCDLPDCTYIGGNLNEMQMHWEKEHDYRVWRRSNKVPFPQEDGYYCYLGGYYQRSWGPFKQIKAQMVFMRNGFKFFEVHQFDKEDEKDYDAMVRSSVENMTPDEYEVMCEVLREHLSRWRLECPICVLGGRDWRHRPTTADCPRARRQDLECVERVYKTVRERSLEPLDKSCKFCLMPGNGCLSRVTGKECDESSWRYVLQVLAGLLRAREGLLSKSVENLEWILRPTKAYGHKMHAIALKIYTLGLGFEVQEDASWAFRYKIPLVETGPRDRLMQCLRIGLSQVCEGCGFHRAKDCENMCIPQEIIELSCKFKFYGKDVCGRSGMPKEACGCDIKCRYDLYSGMDTIHPLPLQKYKKWYDKWMDDRVMVKELSKCVYVDGREYSRLAVEIANLYGAGVSFTPGMWSVNLHDKKLG